MWVLGGGGGGDYATGKLYAIILKLSLPAHL